MIEVINLISSVGLGAGITMASNVLNDVTDIFLNLSKNARENREQKQEHWIQTYDRRELSFKTAREYKGTQGFHKTRQWIAKLVIFCYFVLPLTLPFLSSLLGVPVTFSIGYYDIFQKWPWSEGIDIVKWVTIGSEHGYPIVITPVMNNTVISIIGMFFGNQMAKK